MPIAAFSKGNGNGNGGGGGGDDDPTVVDQVDFGDVFGDLMHIRRDETTGQPIFAQRWIEMPADELGYGWGYCAIAVSDYLVDTDPDSEKYGDFSLDDLGNPIAGHSELPFTPYTCEVDALFADKVVEVDYFGRLNASRTIERNQRMHLNEVIVNIQQAGRLALDPTGRLMMGYECVEDGDCLWSTVDSPMENMGLYTRLMKYGHIATDPNEEDLWYHGDPAVYDDGGFPVHPALSEQDFQKIKDAGLDYLIPAVGCWTTSSEFIAYCADPELLTKEDFDGGAVFLGSAAGKHGWSSKDLVQYVNRFLRITQTTDVAEATLATLRARVRDCWLDENPPNDPPEDLAEGEYYPDPVYLDPELCDVFDATEDNTPNYTTFTNVQELFVDFAPADYSRDDFLVDSTAKLLLHVANVDSEGNPIAPIDWAVNYAVSLNNWVTVANPIDPVDGYGVEVNNFVTATNDTTRAIEYIHNYEVPENLYCIYAVGSLLCPSID